jgi:hypothetical protein
MTEPSPSRFFALVLRPEPTIAGSALVVLGTYAWVGVNDPTDIRQISVLALMVQMFAAATGYRERVLSGHFDPILVTGSPRAAVAASHWLVSIAPGALVWIVLGTLLLPTALSTPFTASGMIAFLYVSSIAWALALPLTRYATGVLWIILFVILSGGSQLQTLHGVFLTDSAAWRDLLAQTGASLVCPMFLLEHTDAARPTTLLLVTMATAATLAAGGWFVATLDAPLKVRR